MPTKKIMVINMKQTDEIIAMFESIAKYCGSNYSRVAASVNEAGNRVARQSLFRMVKNGSLKVSILFDVLDALGVNLIFEKNGEEIYRRGSSAKGLDDKEA